MANKYLLETSLAQTIGSEITFASGVIPPSALSQPGGDANVPTTGDVKALMAQSAAKGSVRAVMQTANGGVLNGVPVSSFSSGILTMEDGPINGEEARGIADWKIDDKVLILSAPNGGDRYAGSYRVTALGGADEFDDGETYAVGDCAWAMDTTIQVLYRNLTGVTGTDPTTDTTNWRACCTSGGGRGWTSGEYYGEGMAVGDADHELFYISLQAGNLNHEPASSPAYWRPLPISGFDTTASAVTFTRTDDFNTSGDVTPGSFWVVTEDEDHAGTFFYLTTEAPDGGFVLGTTLLSISGMQVTSEDPPSAFYGNVRTVEAMDADFATNFTYSTGVLTVGMNTDINDVTIGGIGDWEVGEKILLLFTGVANPGGGVPYAPHSGVYTLTVQGDGSTPFTLTRATDMNQAAEFRPGMYVRVSEGPQANSFYFLANTGAFVVDTTVPEFIRIAPQASSSFLYSARTADTFGAPAATNFLYDPDTLTLSGAANGSINDAELGGVTDLEEDDAVVLTFTGQSDPGSSHPYAPQSGVYRLTVVGDGSTPFEFVRDGTLDSSAKIVNGAQIIVEDGDNSGYYILQTYGNGDGGTTLDETYLKFTNIFDLTDAGGGGGGGGATVDMYLGGLQAVVTVDEDLAELLTYNSGAKTLTSTGPVSVNTLLGALDGNTSLMVASHIGLIFQGGTDPGSNHPYAPQSGIYDVTTVGDGSTQFVLTRNSSLDDDTDISTYGRFATITHGNQAGELFIFTGAGGMPTLDAVGLFFTVTGPTQGGQDTILIGTADGYAQLDAAAGLELTYDSGAMTLTAEANGSINSSTIATESGITTYSTGWNILLVFEESSDPGGNHPFGPQTGLYSVTSTGNGGAPFVLTRTSGFNDDDDLNHLGRFVTIQQGTYAGGMAVYTGASGGPGIDAATPFFRLVGVPQDEGGGGVALSHLSTPLQAAVAEDANQVLGAAVSGDILTVVATINVPLSQRVWIEAIVGATDASDNTMSFVQRGVGCFRRGASGSAILVPLAAGGDALMDPAFANAGSTLTGSSWVFNAENDSSGNVTILYTGVPAVNQLVNVVVRMHRA